MVNNELDKLVTDSLKKVLLFVPIIGMYLGLKKSDEYITENINSYFASIFMQALYCAIIVLGLLNLLNKL